MQTEPTVNILVSLDPGATLPTKAHPSDIGYDVKALSVSVSPQQPLPHKAAALPISPSNSYHLLLRNSYFVTRNSP